MHAVVQSCSKAMGRSVAAQDGSGGAERAAFDQRRKRDRKEEREGMAW